MENILAAYGYDSSEDICDEKTVVVDDDYQSCDCNPSQNGSKPEAVLNDYQSDEEVPFRNDASQNDSKTEQFVKHASFDGNAAKSKKGCVYENYYSDEAETSEEEQSLRDARFDKELLNFYVKNKVKKLKRKLISSRLDKTPISQAFKRKKTVINETTTFTRYSGTYYSSVVKLLTEKQRSVLINYGAECMLNIEKTDVPLRFVKWVAGKFDTRTSEIQVGKQFIAVTKQTIHKILELPIGGVELVADSRAGRSFILSHFNVTCVPQVSYFGNKLSSGEHLSDDDIFICFMAVAFQCFLCPNSSLQPSTEYLHILRDPSSVMKYDLCKYVYDWLISSIKKFQKATKRAARRQITLGGNHLSLAVAYLDSVEFGLNSLPDTVPRALVWKGSRIRKYAELDKLSGNSYGKRPLKSSFANKIQAPRPKFHETTVPNVQEHEDPFTSKLKSMLSFCLNDQQIDRIHDIVNISRNGQSIDSQQQCENIVCDVLSTIFASKQSAKSAVDNVFESRNIQHTPSAKTSNDILPSSTSAFDVNPSISRGKLASRKYQRLANMLDPRGGANLTQEPNKYMANDVPIIPESDPPKAEVTGNNANIQPCTQDCPIDIIDSQHLNSVSPMKKVKPKCSDFSKSNQNLNSLSTGNVPEPNGLSPIIPITLFQPTKDQAIGFVKTNQSGPYQVSTYAGCFFTPPAPRLSNLMNKSNSIDLSSPVCQQNQVYVLNQTSIDQPIHPQARNSQQNSMNVMNSVDLTSPVCATTQIFLVQDSPDKANLCPDVQITAVNTFDQRCNMLSKQATEAYNKLVLCSNSGCKQVVRNAILVESPVQQCVQISPSSQGAEKQSNYIVQNVRPTSIQLEADLNNKNKGEQGSSSRSTHGFVPTRVTMPGRYTRLPYVSQVNRYPVSNSERRYYSAMCLIGEHDDWKGIDAVKYDKAYCSFDSLASLQPFGHVDNYVILVLCRKLFLDKHPVQSRKHCFFSYIGETILKYNGMNGEIVKGAFVGANKALKMWKADQLNFPICVDEHWFTFAVCLKAECFAFLDSLYSKNSDFHRYVDQTLIDNFITLWDMFVAPLMTKRIDFTKFKTIHPDVPRQNNVDDCGVFTAKIISVWHPRLNLQTVISADDILNLRIKFANELYFATYNSVDKTIVPEFFGDVGL